MKTTISFHFVTIVLLSAAISNISIDNSAEDEITTVALTNPTSNKFVKPFNGTTSNYEIVLAPNSNDADPIAITQADNIKEPTPINFEEIKKIIGYPAMAKEAEIEGRVIVRVLVDEKGNYIKHTVLKDPHPILTKAVTDKIDRLIFNPAIQNNKPIKGWITLPFHFSLLNKN